MRKAHICSEAMTHTTPASLEPPELIWPPRCEICGRFMPVYREYEGEDPIGLGQTDVTGRPD
jgi:hypothetical protein